MKRILTYLAMALAAISVISCSESKRREALLPNISGKAGEVIVVIDKGQWEGVVGTTFWHANALSSLRENRSTHL